MNWSIIGHKNILEYLKNSIVGGRLAHAYLFFGPKGVGKKEVAKSFIKNLLCYERQKSNGVENPIVPCNNCEYCQGILKGTHTDYYWVKKEEEEKNISVDEIRELKNKLANKSFFKSYKIAVVENAEQLSLSAANALLKVLEEPLGKTIIILIAERIDTLPKTIISRTQKISFLPVKKTEIYQYLCQERKINRELAWALSTLSLGLPGRALFYLENKALWQKYVSNINTFLKILSAKKHEKIKFVEALTGSEKNLSSQAEEIIPLLSFWQSMFRDLLLLKLGLSDKIINSKIKTELSQLETFFSQEKISRIIKEIELSKLYLSQNGNTKLVLENLILNF